MANHRGVKLRKAKGQYTENRTANVQMSQTIFTDLYTQSHTFRFFSTSQSIPTAVGGTLILFNCSTWSFIMALRARQVIIIMKTVLASLQIRDITPILKQLQWLPIIRQLEVRDATMVFKCLNGLAPPYLCQKFKTRSEVHNRNTRNRTAYIYHSVGRLQVSAPLPSEAQGCGIVSQTSFSLSLIQMYFRLK